MASKLELMAEAYRRGILPPDKVPLFEEAQRRGLIGDVGSKAAPKSPTGTDRSGWSPEMRKGYEEQRQFMTEQGVSPGSVDLLTNSATFGFSDELAAGAQAAAKTAGDFLAGRQTNFSKRYDEEWGGEQARLDAARENAWGGGLPADIAGGLAMAPKAAAGAVAGPVYNSLREAAAASAKVGAGYGAAYGVGADDSGTLEGRASGGAQGAAAGYLLGRAIPNAAAAYSATKDRLVTQPIQRYRDTVSREAMEAGRDFQQAGIDPETVFPPALTTSEPIESTTQNLAGTIFGGRLREGARQSITDVERRIAEEMQAAGGQRSTAEAGQQVQDMLRRNLTERSIPSDQVKAFDQGRLQDISGVAPGPKFDPPPPRVAPIKPEPVTPQTADDVLRAAEMEVPDIPPQFPQARQPQYPEEVTPNYRVPTFEEIPPPPEMVRQRENLVSMYDEAVNRYNALTTGQQKLDEEIASIMQQAGVDDATMRGSDLIVTMGGQRYKWNGRELVAPRLPPQVPGEAAPAAQQSRGIFGMMAGGRQPTAQAEAAARIPSVPVNEAQAMALQRLKAVRSIASERANMIEGLANQARNIRSEIDTLGQNIEKARSEGLARVARQLREQEDARVAAMNARLPQRRTEAEQRAAALTEQDRRIATEMAAKQTADARRAARARVQGNADELARSRTEQLQREAEEAARRQTEEAQKAATQQHQEEIARRRARANEEFRIGRSDQSYVTELDAAYEAVARNTPAIQRNPLGGRNDTERTSVANLLNEFALEARRANKLPGYRDGQPFGDNGGVRDDLLAYVEERLGSEIGSRLRAYSNARAGGKFSPGVQGLRDLRTAIGREIEAAGRARAMGETRTADEAMLSRLYDALSSDMQTFLRAAGPEGQLAAQQMRTVDAAYKEFITDLRVPLSKVFGEKVAPEQAITKLRKAARADGGDIDLLRRFYRVAGDKGDRLHATNAILSDMLDDGLQGFLKQWRNLSPEARLIMFQGNARQYGESLDALARAGGHLERFIKVSQRGGRLRETVSNPGNILAVMAGFLNIPSAMVGVMGATSASRMLSSKAFGRWLQQAPKAMNNQKQWNSHMGRLRAMILEQTGANEAAAETAAGSVRSRQETNLNIPAVRPVNRALEYQYRQEQMAVDGN